MIVSIKPIHELKFNSVEDEFFDFYAFVNDKKYWGTAFSKACVSSIINRLGYFSEPNSIILNQLTIKNLEGAVINLNETDELQFVFEIINSN